MTRKTERYMPTPEEDAEITAAALSDPDAQPLTDEELENIVPMSMEEVFALAEGKVAVTLFLDPALLDAFTSTGPEWRTCMNEVLAAWAKARHLA